MREGFPVAAHLLQRALAEPGLESRQEVNILCELAWMAHQRGDNREAARHAEAGLVLAEQLADPPTLVIALAAVAQIVFARTGAIRHDLLVRALELERSLDGEGYSASGWWTWHAGLPMRLSPSRVTLALLLGRSDYHDESRGHWKTLTAEARERADPDVVRCLFHRAQMEMTAGAWGTAAQLCDEAIQITREIGLEVIESLCLSIFAEIDAYSGETEKARRAIPELLRFAEAGMFRWAAFRLRTALAVLELSYDDAAAAVTYAAPLLDVEDLDAALAQLAGSVGIEALLAAGDLGRARQLLAQIDRRAADGDTALRALVLRCRGLILGSEGEFEPAIASLEEAAVAPDPPMGVNPFELARTLFALGRVQRRAKRRRDARASLERAVALFEELKARVWAENARGELARLGGRAPSGELTASERRLAELVANGRSNKEAAAALFVTPKTVETTLSRIYAKLGIHSRGELVRHLREMKL
jgi:DNA-binding CsgD family transcriptional regulator